MVINSLSLAFTETWVLHLFLTLPSGCLNPLLHLWIFKVSTAYRNLITGTSSVLPALTMKDEDINFWTKNTAALCSQSFQNHIKPHILPCDTLETKWH